MRINELPVDQIKIGMRIRSIKDPSKIGTIVAKDNLPNDDPFFWILWPPNDKPYGGFYWNNCKCEIVEEGNNGS